MSEAKTMTPAEILALPMAQNDAEAATIKDYLKALLASLMTEGEGFSGKRPFGNSGWEYDIYAALVRGGAIEGSFDEDGFIEQVDDEEASAIMLKAIDAL